MSRREIQAKAKFVSKSTLLSVGQSRLSDMASRAFHAVEISGAPGSSSKSDVAAPVMGSTNLSVNYTMPYVKTYATPSHFYDDESFSTVANWSIGHCINVKVSRRLLHTVKVMSVLLSKKP